MGRSKEIRKVQNCWANLLWLAKTMSELGEIQLWLTLALRPIPNIDQKSFVP